MTEVMKLERAPNGTLHPESAWTGAGAWHLKSDRQSVPRATHTGRGAALPHICQLHTLVLAQPHLSPSLECVARAPSSLFVKEAGWVVPREGNESS